MTLRNTFAFFLVLTATDQTQALESGASHETSIPSTMARWRPGDAGAIRGLTIGPIESNLHPGKGYGSAACAQSMREARRMGATWISLTPFGRVWDLKPSGVSLTFELDFEENRRAVRRAVEQAKREGLRVMLVPHLWVETGGWRALIDPGSDAAWSRWEQSYRRFLFAWAALAEETGVDLLSVGVELRSWVTTTRAPTFISLIRDVRKIYSGPLTYAANWDDLNTTIIFGELDVIGINAFFPLAEKEGASFSELHAGGRRVKQQLEGLTRAWGRPLLFTEFGYTTRDNPAIKPWEWPDHMSQVRVNQQAQAEAYAALLGPMTDLKNFAGFFVWRVYADPYDTSQEAEWGFSPKGKLAELVLRDAFRAHWAVDGPRPLAFELDYPKSRGIGVY